MVAIVNRDLPNRDLSVELVTAPQFAAARERIRDAVLHTPLVRLASVTDAVAYLKAESLQPIGSFKLRGAFNAVAQLSEAQRRRGVITYSSGNHAQGVEHGYAIIPPYDDPAIIAGQGVCGLEILADCPQVDLVLAPVGGGGLLSGVAAAIRQQRPECHVVGVEPELAGDAAASLRKGKIVQYTAEQTTRTLADGLRTQSLGNLNFAHIQRYVEQVVTVTEQEIEQAMRHIAWDARLIAEPSGAVATAALLFHAPELPPHRTAVAIVSGGNAEPATLLRVLGSA
jgi:threonine dehydratase